MSQHPDRDRTLMGLRRAFAPTFRAGGMLLFIPWRRRAPRRQTDPLKPPISFLVELRSGRRWRRRRLSRRSYGVDVTTPRSRPHADGSPPCFRSDISGWRDAPLYPLAAPRAAPTDRPA